jgi:hypothetical protein
VVEQRDLDFVGYTDLLNRDQTRSWRSTTVPTLLTNRRECQHQEESDFFQLKALYSVLLWKQHSAGPHTSGALEMALQPQHQIPPRRCASFFLVHGAPSAGIGTMCIKLLQSCKEDEGYLVELMTGCGGAC